MCGFCGVIHWEGAPVAREELSAMLRRVQYRGPDESCVAYPSPGVGLAHARLRVIDLTPGGRQPMASDDGQVWLLFNGEIYNFQDLRRALAAEGALFRSRSDTEVILRAYERWGTDAIRRLEGMFAIALWDGRRRELVLARDRIGKKPLFYWTDGQCVTFGSEIKSLLAHPHVPCAVEKSVLPFLLAYGYPPLGETCYAGIRQVPPASLLRLTAGHAAQQPERYWQLSLATTHRGSVEQAREGLRQRVTAAVQRRLVADVPLGAFLSGGIDSSIIVGLMAQLCGGTRVKTFSVGFTGDPRFNETRYAELVAQRHHTDHTVFTVTPDSFELVPRLVWHHDQPFGDSSAIPTYLLSQQTRQHVTVALCGDGGDELFAGYPRFAAGIYTERVPRWCFRVMHQLLRPLPAGHDRTLLARVKRLAAAASLPMPERFFRWLMFSGAAVEQPYSHPTLRAWWRQSEGWSLLARLLHLNFQEYLPNDLAVKMDRCSMAHGLEVRSPFLDTAVIEFVAGLPDHYKLRGLRTKWLLLHTFRDLLPPAVFHRRDKMGFSIPVGTWWRRQWRQPLLDYLNHPSASVYQYVERAPVEATIRDHLEGRADYGHRLWLLLTLELWLRQVAAARAADPFPSRSAGPLMDVTSSVRHAL